MSRLNRKKQKASRRGAYIIRAMGSPGKWDVIYFGILCGMELTRREAINLAFQWSRLTHRVKIYGQDAEGRWHRNNCEKIARNPARATPCDCSRLVVR